MFDIETAWQPDREHNQLATLPSGGRTWKAKLCSVPACGPRCIGRVETSHRADPQPNTATVDEVCRTLKGAGMDVRRTPSTQLATNRTGEAIYKPLEGEDLSRHIIANKVGYYRLLLKVAQEQAREPWVLCMLKAEEEIS